MDKLSLLLVLFAVLATPAYAGEIDTGAVIGGGVGGAAGAAVGSADGGREGVSVAGRGPSGLRRRTRR